MDSLKPGFRHVRKTRRNRVTNIIKRMEYDKDPQTAELLRLSQEDMFNFKRSITPMMEERELLIQKALSAELPLLEKARIQAAKGDPNKVKDAYYYDKKLLKHFHRRMSTHGQDISAELHTMKQLHELKEDDEARRRRRASQFSLSDYDEERGFSDEPISVPVEPERYATQMTPETLEEAIELEYDLLRERKRNRRRKILEDWDERHEPPAVSELRVFELSHRMQVRWPLLRKLTGEDGEDQAWRLPSQWIPKFDPSKNTAIADTAAMPRVLINAAAETCLQLWEGCPSTNNAEQHLTVKTIYHRHCPPLISPSIWTYPGNVVCFMNRVGTLDVLNRHPFDREAWWVTRFSLPESFMKRVPAGYSLSATPLGAGHLALFCFQRQVNPNVKVAPLGACWIVPKAELSTGANVVSLPPVPMNYYKPFSAKDNLFVIGFDHHSDSHYTILALVWETPETPVWQETEMTTLPVYWSEDNLIGDSPETMHREGTASICVAEDQSKIFITAPTATGQHLLIIDTETWDFVDEPTTAPPAWGVALMHDPVHNRLILAGGIGHSVPEPIVRTVSLDTFDWKILRPETTPYLGAYAGAFPIGPGSFAVVGGFWRTGLRNQQIQPSSSITILHTTNCNDFRMQTLLEKLGPKYMPEGPSEEVEELEGEGELDGEESEFNLDGEDAVNTTFKKS